MMQLLIATLLAGFLLQNGVKSNALTRDEHLDAVVPNINRPRDIVTRVKYLDPRQIERMPIEVPQLINPKEHDDNLLDISSEDESSDSGDLWSAWSEWNDCSRSCGGGVSSRERSCNSRSPTLVDLQCRGKPVQHRLCNTQACPEGSPDFREVQCSQRNGEEFFSSTFEWVPYSGKDGNTCELLCQPKEYHFFNSFGTALDGTRCGSGRKGICVKGECIQIGCDGTVGSRTSVDSCGVCGGSNTTCSRYQGIVDHLPDGAHDSGYGQILEIPTGATSIRIRDFNSNYLAIAEVEGRHETYIINGGWVISYPGEFKTAGTVAIYDRVNDRESIILSGPTTKTIRVMVLSVGQTPQVEYEYWLPRRISESGNSEWRFQQSSILHILNEDDLRNQILSAGHDFNAVVPPSSVPTKSSTTTMTTTATTEVLPAKPQGGISRPGQCRSCKKVFNKKKQLCDSDFIAHVRISPRRPLHRGRFVRYEVEVLSSYKSNIKMLRREYVWISSTCCPRLRSYRHYLLMGRTIKVESTRGKSSDSIDINPDKPVQYETMLVVDHAEAWYSLRKYQLKMVRSAKHINCKRYKYLARRKHADV